MCVHIIYVDGLEYKDLLSMCIRYKDHIQDTAAVVAVEQVTANTHTQFSLC